MTFKTLPISKLLVLNLAMVALVFWANSTALWATVDASTVLIEISRMLALISSTPAATVCVFALTWTAEFETTLA